MRDKLFGPSAALRKPGEPLLLQAPEPTKSTDQSGEGTAALADWFKQRKRQRNLLVLESLRGN